MRSSTLHWPDTVDNFEVGDKLTIEQLDGEFTVVSHLPDNWLLVQNENDELGMVHTDYVVKLNKKKENN